MTTLVSISPPQLSTAGSAELEAHRLRTVPVVVISPHNQCDCRCVMCDIWRIREPEEFSVADLDLQIASFHELGVRWVVFTGGEPQKNSNLPILARLLRASGIRTTLLTAGLLLESQAEMIARVIDDVIVSLDGPQVLHDRIRRVPGAFERLSKGVKELRRFRPGMAIGARCTVQKLNHSSLRATVLAARDLELSSISFLAADVTSEAFNREGGWSKEQRDKVLLTEAEVDALEQEFNCLITGHGDYFASGYIAESPEKLRRIASHFRSCLGQAEPIAPRCNAPWVSAVVDATGEVRPCFFHRALGNIHDATFQEIVNSPRALQFRRDLDIASNSICRKCVCSLYIPNADPSGKSR